MQPHVPRFGFAIEASMTKQAIDAASSPPAHQIKGIVGEQEMGIG